MRLAGRIFQRTRSKAEDGLNGALLSMKAAKGDCAVQRPLLVEAVLWSRLAGGHNRLQRA